VLFKFVVSYPCILGDILGYLVYIFLTYGSMQSEENTYFRSASKTLKIILLLIWIIFLFNGGSTIRALSVHNMRILVLQGLGEDCFCTQPYPWKKVVSTTWICDLLVIKEQSCYCYQELPLTEDSPCLMFFLMVLEVDMGNK